MPAIILGLATFLYWVSLYIYLPVFPGYVRDLGASSTWIGVITGSYGISLLLLRIPIGIWADRLGQYKPFVLAGCILAVISGLVLALAGGHIGLVIGRTLAGLAATFWLAFMVLYGTYFPQSMSLAIIIMSTIGNLSTLVGLSIGPYVTAHFGLRGVFYLSAGCGLAATAIAALAPELRQQSGKHYPSVTELLRVCTNPKIVAVSLLATISTYLQFAGTLVFVNDWAQQRLMATSIQLGILALYTGVPTVVATLFAGTWIVPRVGIRFTVFIGFLISALTIAVVPLLSDMQSLYWTQAVGGLAFGLLIPQLMAYVMELVPVDSSAAALGFFQSTLALGMVLGPLITGFIGDRLGLSKAFFVLGVLAFLGAGIAVWLLPSKSNFHYEEKLRFYRK